MSENRREFFRVYFDHFINGEIIEDEKSTPIKIDNMSAGGMGFVTAVPFSLNERVTCGFNLLEQYFEIEGYINRRVVSGSLVEYGVKFETDQATTSKLFKQLNFYAIRQKR